MDTNLQQRNTKKDDMKKKDLGLRAFLIFSAVIIAVCFFVVIFNYDTAFDSSGDWFPRSMTVQIYYVFTAVAAMAAAVVLKCIYNERVSFSVLLATSVILPVL